MLEYLQALVLGIVQGLTEFLPVSSSGHLELAKYLLGDKSTGMESMQMTVVLHVATALSTCVVFREDITQLLARIFFKEGIAERNFAVKILVSMIPAVIVGLMWEDTIDQMFAGKIFLVASMLILTGILLLVTHYFHKTDGDISLTKALIIGIAQAIAITPGISRSGSTIATALLLNTSKHEAARFSFLMVLPLIFGKIAKDLIDGDAQSTHYSAMAMVIGFFAAFITGMIACTWMITLVKNLQLRYFAYYCFVIGMGFIAYISLVK